MSIFLILFFIPHLGFAKTYWKSEKILEILDNDAFLLQSKKILKPQNILIESQFSKSSHKHCQQKKIYKLLEKILKNKKIYYQQDIKYKKRDFKDKYIRSSIKFYLEDKSRKRYDLEVFLLENGLARNKNFENKKYIEAENLAKNKHIGVWGECNPWNDLQRNLWQKAQTKSFPTPYRFFLKTDTSAWVSKIFSDNRIQLRNGLIIKLQNVFMGDLKKDKNLKKINTLKEEKKSKNSLEKCFQKKSHIFLKKHLLGKKIILKKTSLQRVGNKTLSRYIFISKKPQGTQKIFFNDFIIQKGFGKFSLDDKNEKSIFMDILKNSQNKIFENPKGAWKICLSEAVDFLKKSETENIMKDEKKSIKIIAENLYDKSCRIKGNISGTKKNPIKKYHTPLSGWYKNLKYEKCFESEKEARDSNFIKVK